MKWWWEQYRHYVNSLYLSANKIMVIFPSQHYTMHWGDFTRWRVHFENRKCQSLQRPKWMNRWQENPISYKNKTFTKSVLQWRFSCTGLNRLLPQKEDDFRCAWIEPNKWQPYGQILIGRGQLSDCSAKSIRWHLLNQRFSINYANIMSDNYCRKSGIRQPVPEAHSPTNLLKWSLLQKTRPMGR